MAIVKARNSPRIKFVEEDTGPLVNKLIAAYEKFTGRTLYPADPNRLFILWIADVIAQDRALTNYAAQQNVPRWADNENLDSLGELFKDEGRLEAKYATVTMRFHISKVLAYQTLVPKGTRVTVDNKIMFVTEADLYIKAGSLYGDMKAVCQTAGPQGNGFVPGQITQLVDLYDFYTRVENVTESAGGSDRESDEAYYERMRESMESYSTAGPMGSFIYHAKTASPLVADVSPSSPEPGVVDVRVLLRDGEMPSEEILQAVSKALSADKTRPMTDYVIISAPDTVEFEVEIKYFIPAPSENSALTIEVDVREAVAEYVRWQTEKMGRDINPSFLVSLLMQTGIKRVEVVKPTFTPIERNAVAVLRGTPEIHPGGFEDE